MRDPRPLRRRLPRAVVRALRGRRRGAGCPPLIGARDRFPPWVARERSRVAPPELSALGVVEAAAEIRRGAVSPVSLVEACLERIRALDGGVQAWVHVDDKGALAAARERAEEAKRSTVRGPVHGIPVAVKDIFHVAGLPTTAGARPFAHSRPGEDATSVARDRKSTRLNSSHSQISYAVFCLKKKKQHTQSEELTHPIQSPARAQLNQERERTLSYWTMILTVRKVRN